MSGGFNNPLVGGGGALVYPSIHSPNFVHLVSGWSINKDGTAEFQTIIARGDISATTLTTTRMTVDATGNINFFNAFGAVVIRIDAQKDAIFLYFDNGSAVQGDLIQSFSVVGGVDSIQADAYSAGIESFGGNRTLTAILNSASLTLTKLSGAFAPPQIQLNDNVLNNGVTLGSVQLSFLLGAGAGILRSQLTTDTGSRFTVNESGTISWGPGTPVLDTTLYRNSAGILASSPILADFSGVGDDWHSMNTRGYQNGWADAGIGEPGAYRLLASPANEVELRGQMTGGTLADGTVIINLPNAYHPTTLQVFEMMTPGSAVLANARFNIGTTGNLTCFGISGLAAGPRCVMPNLRYSLD